MRRAVLAALFLLAVDCSAALGQNVNAVLCQVGPKAPNAALVSPNATMEISRYLEGLKKGTYAFNSSMSGFEAAAKLRFGKRFAAVYGEMVEEAQLRMQERGRVHIDDVIQYLDSILAEEKRIDTLMSEHSARFPAIVYLRALQEGECSFPYVLRDTPAAGELLSQLRRAYPQLGLPANSSDFIRLYDKTVASARTRISQAGSVSIYRNIADLRHAILN